MSKLSIDSRRNARNILVLCVLSLLFYAPAIIAVACGDWPFTDDAAGLFAPWHAFATQNLRAGVWPLWNPHLFAGLPFMANGQSGVLYAPNLIYLFLSPRSGLLCDALWHQFILVAGAYFLGRTIGLRRTSCVLLGLTMGLGASVAAHIYTGHMSWHAARAWLPWQLWALHSYAKSQRNVRSGQMRYAWLLGAFFALQVAAGYPPLVIVGAGLCACYVIARSLLNWRHRGALWPRNWPRALAIAIVIAAGLCASILLPLREASALSVHGSGIDWYDAVLLSGSWKSFVRLLLPELFGSTSALQWSMPYGAHEEAAAIGLLPFLLAMSAPWWTRRMPNNQRATWWLLALMLAAALMALGQNAPFYRVAYEHLGLIRQLRVPVRWLEIWYLAASVAAALSFDAWYRTAGTCNAENAQLSPDSSASTCSLFAREHRVLAAGLALVMTLVAGAGLWFWLRPVDGEFWRVTVQVLAAARGQEDRVGNARFLRDTALLQCGWTLLLCALGLLFCWRGARAQWKLSHWRIAILLWVAADLGLVFLSSERTWRPGEGSQWPTSLVARYQTGQRWDTNVDWRTVNSAMTHNIDIFNGYDALNSKAFWQLVRAVEKRDFWMDMYQPTHRGPALAIASVTHTLIYASALEHWKPNAHMKLIAQDGGWQLWQHDNSWPRYYLTRHILRAAPAQTENALQVLAARANPANGDYPVLLSDSVTLPFAADNQNSAPGRVLQWQRGTNHLNLQIESHAPAMLSIGEAYFPGWHVWVNGREQQLLQANAMFQAVAVPRGHSRVQLVYAPQSFRLGAFMSLCALAACGAALMAFVGGRKKNTNTK